MENPKYKEHTIASGEVISLTYPGDHPKKPWNVSCWDTNDECRWSVNFASEAEAESEYIRFD